MRSILVSFGIRQTAKAVEKCTSDRNDDTIAADRPVARTPSQASPPLPVARAPLPSSRTRPNIAFRWYTGVGKVPTPAPKVRRHAHRLQSTNEIVASLIASCLCRYRLNRAVSFLRDTMNKNLYIPIAKSPSAQKHFFRCLAFELRRARRNFTFDKPEYCNSETGLSIVITHVSSDVYSILELCIMSMGHEPIPECGVVRAVVLDSVDEKEKFRSDFDRLFRNAEHEVSLMNGMSPSDFLRMQCKPKVCGILDEASTHSAFLLLTIDSETTKSVWIEYSGENGGSLEEVAGQLPDSPEKKYKIEFYKKNTRDRFVKTLQRMAMTS